MSDTVKLEKKLLIFYFKFLPNFKNFCILRTKSLPFKTVRFDLSKENERKTTPSPAY